MKQITWVSMFGVLAAVGCAAEVSSTQSNLIVCEGDPIDGTACLVGDGGLCATATNTEGNLCECFDVPGSRTGRWECFPAEPSGDNTCRDVVEGEACMGAEDSCVRSYAGFDVVCECGAPPGTRPLNTWSCHAVSTCEGPACECDSPEGCPDPGPADVCDSPEGCTDPGPADECDRAGGCTEPGPAGECDRAGGCTEPGPADECDRAGGCEGPSTCPEGAECEPAGCEPGEDCGPADECPGTADCGPTCDVREAAMRRCERDYEACLVGPPSLISCDDQLMHCVAALPSCSETR